MRVKGVDYPIEWVGVDMAFDVLDTVFNKDAINEVARGEKNEDIAVEKYRLSPEDLEVIAEAMRCCIPSIPDEFFFQTRDGLMTLRLGATEILNFTFELLQAATKKKISDIEEYLEQQNLSEQEVKRLNNALNNASQTADELASQIKEMQLAYLESLSSIQPPNKEPQIVGLPNNSPNNSAIAANIRQNDQQRNKQQRQKQLQLQKQRQQKNL